MSAGMLLQSELPLRSPSPGRISGPIRPFSVTSQLVFISFSKNSRFFQKKLRKSIDKTDKMCYNKTIERTKTIPKQSGSRSTMIQRRIGRCVASDTSDNSSFYMGHAVFPVCAADFRWIRPQISGSERMREANGYGREHPNHWRRLAHGVFCMTL